MRLQVVAICKCDAVADTETRTHCTMDLWIEIAHLYQSCTCDPGEYCIPKRAKNMVYRQLPFFRQSQSNVEGAAQQPSPSSWSTLCWNSELLISVMQHVQTLDHQSVYELTYVIRISVTSATHCSGNDGSLWAVSILPLTARHPCRPRSTI